MQLDLKLLDEILKSTSITGYEFQGTLLEIIKREFSKVKGTVFKDRIGNIGISVGDGPTKVLFSAHYDEIGYQVSGITEEGMIRFKGLGGVDEKILPNSIVKIITKDSTVKGVIGKLPIHIDYEDKSCIKLENLIIDCGFEGKIEAESRIKIGDLIIIDSDPILNLGHHRLAGRALDDKLGVAVLLKILEWYSTNINPEITLTVLFTCQEETGCRGAARIIRDLNPDISIDIDMIVANDEGRELNSKKYGNIKLGEGPVIQKGVTCSPKLVKEVIQAAERINIARQITVLQVGGTNTRIIQLEADCYTSLISLPVRNMHTNVEVADYRDIQGLLEILGEILLIIPRRNWD